MMSSGHISLTAYVGWLDHPTGIVLTTRLSAFNQNYLDSNPLRGTWFGVTAQGSLTDRVGVLVSAGMLAPTRSRGEDLETVSGTSVGDTLSGTTWGSIEGLMTYSVSGSLQAIGGFRWDHFDTRWRFSVVPTFLDFELNAYVPLIGVQLDQRFFGGELITRIVGWPGVIPGHMTQTYVGGPSLPAWNREEQTPNHGYFMEFFTEYRRTFFGSGSGGVFLRWNSLHAAADESGYDWRVANTTGTGLVTQSFSRQSWTIGGSLTLDFSLPDFL